MENLNNSYRQPETLQLAPDALVFINGSNLLEDSEGKVFDIREDITEISTSLSVDTVPGTANFTISLPEHSGGRVGFKKYENLKVMSEVVIYFRGRFLKNGKYPYYQAFWGMISAITENYNDGVNTLSVSCVDILRWWEITNIVINPSLLATRENLHGYLHNVFGIEKEDVKAFLNGETIKNIDGKSVSIFGNIFAGMTIPQIFEKMSTISFLQMTPVNDYLNSTAAASPVTNDLRNKKSLMEYWIERFNLVGKNLKIYGLVKKNGKLDIDMTKVVFGATESQIPDETKIYQTIPTTVKVDKSDKRSQLEIAKELKESIHFEFFMDVNGDIILKPPFYNLDVSKNIPNSILHDLDIINWNFIQSESEVVTRVDVSGAIANVSDYNQTINGIAYDSFLALQFGERTRQRSMPWLRTSEQCLFWGQAELARQNALINQGTITIIGRPELKLGYPIYVPSRDAFYYVKGIENSFSFGGTFTTTLTLVAERTRGKENLKLFRNVGEIKDEQIPISGNSIADETNFSKQIFMPNVCTPRAKEHIDIVQPNFAIDLDKKKSDILSKWELKNDSHIDPITLEEFQITDPSGFKIIGKIGGSEIYLHYGYYDKLSSSGSLENNEYRSYNFNLKSKDAEKALKMSVENNILEIDPNNTMLEDLDTIGAKLVDLNTKVKFTPSVAYKSYNFDIKS